MLTHAQFDRTRHLALALAGIELAARHRELLGHRTRRLGLTEADRLTDLLDATEAGEAAATRKFIALVTTQYTGFFRHPRHFEIAAEHALWAAHRRGIARLWSAAAATGEEPWSLAMAAVEVFRQAEPPVEILGTDINLEALAVAGRGAYGERAVEALGAERRRRFVVESDSAPPHVLVPGLRRLVQFRAVNLASVTWGIAGPFDVVFCRNVLMYLETCHRYAVIERMASLLAPDGLLVLDPAEHLGRAAHWFTAGGGGVYARRPAPGPPRRRGLARTGASGTGGPGRGETPDGWWAVALAVPGRRPGGTGDPGSPSEAGLPVCGERRP